MKAASRPQNTSCEHEFRFLQDRITSIEKHFADLCAAFAAYTGKIARVRDKGDELAKVLGDYGEAESVNKTLKTGLGQLAETLSGVGDYRDAQVQRLESKVVERLSQYEGTFKHTKDDIKNISSIRDKEVSRRKTLDRIRERNPRNRQQITMAESELQKASSDLSRNLKATEEQMDEFESKKLQDLKAILLDYISIELSYHAKALELFTTAYNDTMGINEAEDLQDFRNVLKVPDSVARLETVKRLSFRGSASLASIASIFHSTSDSHLSPGIPHTSSPRRLQSHSVDSLKQEDSDGSEESVNVEDYDEESSLSDTKYKRK